MQRSSRWQEPVGRLVAGTIGAVALWALGLTEVLWAPYFVAAVYTKPTRPCLPGKGPRS